MMFTEIGIDVKKAAELLRKDELVAIPTETVYGLAGNALSETAVAKIYAAKNRPAFNPLILHVSGMDQIEQYAIADTHSLLIAKALMPGPLTLLLPKKKNVPDLTTAGSDKVAIRVPNHPLTLELLKQLDFPLAAPSANPSGYISPTTAAHVQEGLNGKIAYILNGGPAIIGLESTICEVSGDKILLHRAGGVSATALTAITGLEVVLPEATHGPHTPGQLKSHYAPHTPLFRGNIEGLIGHYPGKKIAVISFNKSYADRPQVSSYVLSPSGNLAEAANKLFATLRKVDAQQFDVILTEVFPEEGIGPAINDRLDRAQFLHK
ncbi:MAG TPA: L-threonylcarbamoyladenylate synthase [Sediminibacterium sp.]|nr:L-threonylcarbamoyladenylate synthase [Sediminibacterium sp.]